MARQISEFPPQIIWAPAINSHDPNPPLPLETSTGLVDATLQVTDNLGTFNAASGALADAAWFASGGSAAEFSGVAAGAIEASWSSVDNLGELNAWAVSGTDDATWFASGVPSAVNFYGERAFTARCEGAYTFDPLGGPAWDGTLRREPEILVQTQANDSPTSSTFTDEEEPALGQNVQLDMNDGHGIILGGTVQSYVTRYEGMTDQLAFDTTIADYLWLLNKRRPFGCFTNVPADEVAQTLRVGFAPPDFSGAGIVPGLPAITVEFDGSLDYTGCMSVICSRLGGAKFKVDRDKVIYLFYDDPAPGPDPIDDDNELLLRDQPLTITRDASQLRNRVFVKGASSKLMADSAIGASEIEIDGFDIWSPVGGEAIIGCDRFTYAGVMQTLVYPPPDASLQVPRSINSNQLISPGNLIEVGPIRTTVRYSAAYVFNGKESQRSAPLGPSPAVARFNPGYGVSTNFLPFAGFLPAGTHTWSLAFRDTGGGLYYDHNIGWVSAGGGDVGAMELHWNAGNSFINERRIATVVLFRKANIPGGDPGPPGSVGGWYYEVASQPFVPGNTLYDFTDGKANASLGNALPWDVSPHPLKYDTIGNRIVVGTLAVRSEAYGVGATQVKIYREEKYNGNFDNTWTTPQVVMTFNTTAPPTGDTSIEDTRATTAHLYATGEAPSNETNTPPPPQPKVRLVLHGVVGLDEAHGEGDEVSLFVQVDDLTAQIEAATREGGDGLHEFMVVDGALRSNSELRARGNAELTLFKDPIVTVSYSSFDSKHTPGGTVEFNLTRPAFVASLKITEVRIDKIHYDHGHVARYNVTASSVKFTLQDLLRRTILRPY